MVARTPFHPRLSELDRTGLWTHWQGYLSCLRYQASVRHEYFAVRAAVGVFDASPLYKYRLTGPGAAAVLVGLLARDPGRCAVGRAQYTFWCDDAGFVLEDGVLFRHGEHDWLLTCARPNLGWLLRAVEHAQARLPGSVAVADVSQRYAALAVQGARSRDVLASLTPAVTGLRCFDVAAATVAGAPVWLSRTGYTGDLGYELLVEAEHALTVLDAVLVAGAGHGIRPFGEDALMMLRLEAGLLLLDVDFGSARYAWTDEQRFTPAELGWGRMLTDLDGDRHFTGRAALRRERERGPRWATVGIMLDPADHRARYAEAGLPAEFAEAATGSESMLYADDRQVGYTTSRGWSPALQRHIALARVRPDFAAAATVLQLETTIDHAYRSISAQVAPLPLFDPPRRTAP